VEPLCKTLAGLQQTMMPSVEAYWLENPSPVKSVKLALAFEVSRTCLESAAKLNSCEALTRNKVRGIFRHSERSWIVTGSSHLDEILQVNLIQIVERSQWAGSLHDYNTMERWTRHRGQLIKFRKKEWVLTGCEATLSPESCDLKRYTPEQAQDPILEIVQLESHVQMWLDRIDATGGDSLSALESIKQWGKVGQLTFAGLREWIPGAFDDRDLRQAIAQVLERQKTYTPEQLYDSVEEKDKSRFSQKGQACGWIETRLGNTHRDVPSTSEYFCYYEIKVQKTKRKRSIYLQKHVAQDVRELVNARSPLPKTLQIIRDLSRKRGKRLSDNQGKDGER